ncbi:MAG TPA: Ig-like domain-containing protein [Flavobacterium sp.]|jgi:hypothetical protein
MKIFYKFSMLLCISLSFIACEPNDNPGGSGGPSGPTIEDNMGATASHDFFGQIVDENNNPVASATVQVGSVSKQTDSNGIFIIKDANVRENFAYITATKAGFINGSRAMIPTSGTNRVKIMLLSADVVATVNSGSASEATLPNGTKVNFDGNFKTESGVAYSGSVSVIMNHLDPSDPLMADKMPGMLLAENENEEAGVLETFGMLNVELRGSSGEILQLASNAQIQVPITAAQMATAPATIPMWHFDEIDGYWKEEGSATKQGNFYVGTVSHFSWWNMDVYFPSVNLTVKVVDSNGNPLSNHFIQLTAEGTVGLSYGQFTDENGEATGLAPSNVTISVKVFNDISQCSAQALYVSTVGPLTSNTDVEVVIEVADVTHYIIQGSLRTCTNVLSSVGYVELNYDGYTQFEIVSDGTFSFSLNTCGNSVTDFTLNGFDYNTMTSTGEINYTLTAPVTTIGDLLACGTEFITYQVDNFQMMHITSNITANAVGNGFLIQNGTGGNATILTGTSSAIGAYTTPDFVLQGPGILLNDSDPNDIILQISSFGAVGEYIDLTFTGNYTDFTGTHHITGVAHVLRDN